MKRILVVGIGSRIMKDDGIGVRVVEALEKTFGAHQIASLLGETDVQCCMEEIRPEDVLIIVDAMVTGKGPGALDVMGLQDALRYRGMLPSQHAFSLLDQIALYTPERQGYLIGIEAAEIEFGLELSAPLQERFESICAAVLQAVYNIKEEQEHA
ncbi:MAG: hypothetical protein H6Q61_690 [Firmicutes bacterium]|nr:hypothetical protein [Bacillota bacterium]